MSTVATKPEAFSIRNISLAQWLKPSVQARSRLAWLNIISHHAHSFSAQSPTHLQKRARAAPYEGKGIEVWYILHVCFNPTRPFISGARSDRPSPCAPPPQPRCLCCSSLGPQLPNSTWKQYLYIYHIFTQYLPFCKTISYLTISPLPPNPHPPV